MEHSGTSTLVKRSGTSRRVCELCLGNRVDELRSVRRACEVHSKLKWQKAVKGFSTAYWRSLIGTRPSKSVFTSWLVLAIILGVGAAVVIAPLAGAGIAMTGIQVPFPRI